MEEQEWDSWITLTWLLGYYGVIMGGRPNWPGYFSALVFTIWIAELLVSVLERFSIIFIVRALKVFRLTLLNKPVIIKRTQTDEPPEDNVVKSRIEERQLPHKTFFVLYIGLLYIAFYTAYYL